MPAIANCRRGLLVTGTDTGVGKTAIGAVLAQLLVTRGVAVKVRKPVESGCAERDGRLFAHDAARLQAAARSSEALNVICPYPLRAAISPERAAALEGRHISLDDAVRACLHGVQPEDFLLVEAAGGFLSPLVRGARVAELAERLQLPVLLVVADRLGSLNQAMLSNEAIAARGLALAAVVLNRIDAEGPAGMDNGADLEMWLQRPVWRILPDRSGAEQAMADALAPLIDKLSRAPAPLPENARRPAG